MSLYRQPSRTRPLLIAAIAAVALLAGLAIGFGLGRSSAPKPSAQDVVAELRDGLRPLAAGLQLLPTEYPQAREGGGESAAVDGDLARIRAALAATAPDLRVLDPTGARALAARVTALEQAIDDTAPSARVARLAAAAQATLAELPGGN
ncbi:MAG TPA: hypothetical protein VKB25_03520 [Conexibacter sp.]|nr:hypothetical protein [Conexibacter sp.]